MASASYREVTHPAGFQCPSNAALRALDRRDPELGRARRRLAPFPVLRDQREGTSHFHALGRAIVFQQLAGAAARTIHDRVVALTPGKRFPTADEIVSLRDLSARSLDGCLRLRSIARLMDEEPVAATPASDDL